MFPSVIHIRGFVFLLCIFAGITTPLIAQCPEVEAIFIDECGPGSDAQHNEFVIIFSGDGFNTNDLQIDFNPPGDNPVLGDQSDVNINSSPCSLTNGNISGYSGCSNLISIGSNFNVPANSIVIFQTTDTPTFIYDFSSLCGNGECVYVIANACNRTTAAFANGQMASDTRTTIFNFSGSCSVTAVYDRALLPGGNGAYYNPMDDTYGNNGCVVPPSSPAQDPVTPDFNLEDEYCVGDTPDNLPNMSDNGIAGSWSPAAINTSLVGTQNYIFTPDAGQCAEPFDLEVTVSPTLVPEFLVNLDYCQNDPPDNLPTTSNNGVTGTWMPPAINTSVPGMTNYIFTPDAGQCADIINMVVTVDPLAAPDFNLEDEYCVGDAPDILPGISDNGITGAWNPPAINTSSSGTTAYTFTPDAGQCASPFVLSVEVTDSQTPDFALEDEYCVGDTPDPLPTTSLNGITGIWIPAVINTSTPGTTVYNFTPDAGQCALLANHTVTVTASVMPMFAPINDVCEGDPAPLLPTTSQNGITGTWNPSTVNTSSPGSFMFTFTPDAGECAESLTITIDVLERPRGSVQGNVNVCPGQCGTVSFTLSGGSGTYDLNLQISVGAFSIPFSVPGATFSTTLTICYTGSGFLPQFQPPTTIIIPQSAPPGSATLTLLSLQDANGGNCAGGIVDNNNMSVTLLDRPDAFDANITVCDDDNDGLGEFDLTAAEDDVTGNNSSLSVYWYTDMALTLPINTPNSFIASDGTIVYAAVEDAFGCRDVTMVTLQLETPEEIDLPTFTVCITDPPLILPILINGVTGNWSDVDGHVVNNQFDPTGLPEGNYTITFTPDIGQCFLSDNTTVQVTSGGPIPLDGIPAELCEGYGIFSLPDMPNGTSGDWTSSSPFLSGNDFNATAAGIGIYTFTFTPNDPNSCFLPNSVDIEVVPNEDLQAPFFPVLCENFGLFTLTVPVDGAFGSWGNNPFVNGNQFNTLAGPGIYTVTFFPDDVCKNDLDVDITVEEAIDPTPPVYPTQCLSSPPITLPNNIDGVVGSWSLNSNIITTFNPAILGNGIFTLVFTPNPGICGNGFSLTITVGSVQAGMDRDTSFCNQGSFLQDLHFFLSPDAQAGGTWFANGTPVPSPTTFDMAGLIDGANLLIYVLEDPSCGNDTAFIRVQVEPLPSAGNDAMISLCDQNTSSVNVSASMGSFDPGGIWTNNRNLPIQFADFSSVDLSSLPAGNTLFTYRFDAGICPGDTALIAIQVDSAFLAGPDVVSQSCIGSSVNLASLIPATFSGGQFQDVNMYGGLSGNTWDASGKTVGDYLFLYITNSNGNCPGDTALITVTLESNISAGDDVLGEYCDGAGFVPIDYMPANASPGGKLFNGPFETPLTMNIIGNLIQYQFLYITGDGLTCPFDTAVWIINRVDKPNINFTLNDISLCEGDCKEIRIVHTSNEVRQILVFRAANANNQDDTRILSLIPGQDLVLEICNDSTKAGSFNNLTGVTFPLSHYFILSFKERSCEYPLTGVGALAWTLESPKIIINETLCAGESLTIGSITFDENNPSGTSLVTGIGADCDSLFTVNLSFAPEARGMIAEETCNQDYSITIGNQQFNRANPTGTVILPGASIFGCDSIVDVNLMFLPPVVNEINEISCDPNFSITIGNTKFDKSKPNGQVTFFNAAVNGCDSIVNVDIQYLSSSMTYIDTTVCDESFTLTLGGTMFSNLNPGGQVVLPGAASSGCDSIINVAISFQNFSPNQITTLPICGDSLGSVAFLNANAPGPYILYINGVENEIIPDLPFEKPLGPGEYDIVLESANGCRLQYGISIPDNSTPEITLDTVGENNVYSLSLQGDISGIYNITWSPPSIFDCTTCTDVQAILLDNITGQVSYQYGDDCFAIIPFALQFTSSGTFELPNAIKVGSSQNGSFYIRRPDNFNGSILSMSIYDRWGNKVFFKENMNWDDPASGWNGTFSTREVIPGVYVYRIEILDISSIKTILLQGDLTVIR